MALQQSRSKLSETFSASHPLTLSGKWLYLRSPSAVWLRRRVSDQINVKTIRSRLQSGVGKPSTWTLDISVRRQEKNPKVWTILRSSLSVASHVKYLWWPRALKSVHFWGDGHRRWRGSRTVWLNLNWKLNKRRSARLSGRPPWKRSSSEGREFALISRGDMWNWGETELKERAIRDVLVGSFTLNRFIHIMKGCFAH